jgi:hypothetical protein
LAALLPLVALRLAQVARLAPGLAQRVPWAVLAQPVHWVPVGPQG